MPFRCLLAAGLLLGAAACSEGDDGDRAVPVTTASTEQPTTTAAPTSTTLDFETEVKLAALELLEVRNEILMHPDPERVGEYLSELCTCFEREIGVLRDFAATGQRWAGPVVEPLAIRMDRDDRGHPSFTVIARQPPGEILSPSGAQPIPEVELAPYFVSLVAEPGAGWRINGLEGLTMERSAALAIIETEGLP